MVLPADRRQQSIRAPETLLPGGLTGLPPDRQRRPIIRAAVPLQSGAAGLSTGQRQPAGVQELSADQVHPVPTGVQDLSAGQVHQVLIKVQGNPHLAEAAVLEAGHPQAKVLLQVIREGNIYPDGLTPWPPLSVREGDFCFGAIL
jgi:hypothetical protein